MSDDVQIERRVVRLSVVVYPCFKQIADTGTESMSEHTYYSDNNRRRHIYN